jgi:hypothetical protein
MHRLGRRNIKHVARRKKKRKEQEVPTADNATAGATLNASVVFPINLPVSAETEESLRRYSPAPTFPAHRASVRRHARERRQVKAREGGREGVRDGGTEGRREGGKEVGR